MKVAIVLQGELLLRAENIHKSLGSTRALKGVGLELYRGEVLGLMGENGSGKSTLASIVAAIQKADEGVIHLKSQPYAPKNCVEATAAGVCMILQEMGTFDQLTVAGNIFVGKEDAFRTHGLIDRRRMNAEARKVLDRIHSDIPADVLLGRLTFEQRKLVELARAVWNDPEILIIDETTTALSREGRDILYSIIDDMKSRGKSVIFISHDIQELMEKCAHLTVLRDGDFIRDLPKAEFDAALIRKLMVGREMTDNYYRSDLSSECGERVVMRAKGLTTRVLHDISFELHEGEILGIGGLADSGMHDVGRALFGVAPPDVGAVEVEGGVAVRDPGAAMRRGIAYIAKNRDRESLMVASSIRDNICIASYPRLRTGPLVLPRSEARCVDEWAEKLEIKMQSPKQFVMELSGGNKQKVALAKWLAFGANILILDCPTRDIDIGVKTNIYRLITDLKHQGKSIVMISEELPELIGMSDRVLIMKDGAVSGMFRREDGLTEAMLINYMV